MAKLIGRRVWKAFAAALLLACTPLQAAEPDVAAAEAIVRDLQESLLSSMKAGATLEYEQRLERLRPVIERTHHFEVIARFMLGPHAAKLDEQELEQVVEALKRLSVAEYATHFDRYKGEKFVLFETSAQTDDRLRVMTELVKANGEPIRIDYLLQRQEGRWGIVNVIADGVSDLALKRAEYGRVLRNEGHAALLKHMREQIGEIRPR